MSDDEAVGYGKPPRHSQFKKGTSGNRKGRPKGSKNLATLFHREMNQKIPISEYGQRKKITKIEAAIKQFVNKAAAGDPKAMQAVMKMAEHLKLPELMQQTQQPRIRRFTLNVFQKDLATGQSVPVQLATRKDS